MSTIGLRSVKAVQTTTLIWSCCTRIATVNFMPLV